jgi:hypothetical protein
VSDASDSDVDPGAPGTADDGSGGGGGTGDASPGQLDDGERRRRDLQSQLDRERARTARLEAELRAASDTGPDSQDGTGPVDEAAVGRMVAATIARETAKADLARTARERFPHADPQLLADLSRFRSAEELEVALARSHEARTEDVRNLTEQVEQEVRARLGGAVTAPDGGGPPPAAGDDLTVGAVQSMGLEALLDPAMDGPLKKLAHRLVDD